MPLPVGAVIPQHYDIANGYMKDFHNVILPPKDDIEFDNDYLWRMAIAEFQVRVWWENGYCWEFTFYPGFWTDYASVPKFCRIAIDNDDPRIIIPAILHDSLFQTHDIDLIMGEGLGFSQANTLLYEACRYYGLPDFMCSRIRDSVNTAIGKKSYDTKHPREVDRRSRMRILSPKQQG